MSGVEFRIGRTDHLMVERFLAAAPAGVAAIIVDATNLSISGQKDAIAAAHNAGVAAYVEPLTDRLVADGFTIQGGSTHPRRQAPPARLKPDGSMEACGDPAARPGQRGAA